MACVTSINVGMSTGNIGKHALTVSHKNNVQQKTGGGSQIGVNHFTVAAPPKKQLSPAQRVEKEECIYNLRAVTHALVLSYGVNPTEMGLVLGPHCLLKDATTVLLLITLAANLVLLVRLASHMVSVELMLCIFRH